MNKCFRLNHNIPSEKFRVKYIKIIIKHAALTAKCEPSSSRDLVLKRRGSPDLVGEVGKKVDARNKLNSQRLGALPRVSSKPNLKINGTVSTTVVRGLVGVQATATICLSKYGMVSKAWYGG